MSPPTSSKARSELSQNLYRWIQSRNGDSDLGNDVADNSQQDVKTAASGNPATSIHSAPNSTSFISLFNTGHLDDTGQTFRQEFDSIYEESYRSIRSGVSDMEAREKTWNGFVDVVQTLTSQQTGGSMLVTVHAEQNRLEFVHYLILRRREQCVVDMRRCFEQREKMDQDERLGWNGVTRTGGHYVYWYCNWVWKNLTSEEKEAAKKFCEDTKDQIPKPAVLMRKAKEKKERLSDVELQLYFLLDAIDVPGQDEEAVKLFNARLQDEKTQIQAYAIRWADRMARRLEGLATTRPDATSAEAGNVLAK